jgi:hypothetical protein
MATIKKSLKTSSKKNVRSRQGSRKTRKNMRGGSSTKAKVRKEKVPPHKLTKTQRRIIKTNYFTKTLPKDVYQAQRNALYSYIAEKSKLLPAVNKNDEYNFYKGLVAQKQTNEVIEQHANKFHAFYNNGKYRDNETTVFGKHPLGYYAGQYAGRDLPNLQRKSIKEFDEDKDIENWQKNPLYKNALEHSNRLINVYKTIKGNKPLTPDEIKGLLEESLYRFYTTYSTEVKDTSFRNKNIFNDVSDKNIIESIMSYKNVGPYDEKDSYSLLTDINEALKKTKKPETSNERRARSLELKLGRELHNSTNTENTPPSNEANLEFMKSIVNNREATIQKEQKIKNTALEALKTKNIPEHVIEMIRSNTSLNHYFTDEKIELIVAKKPNDNYMAIRLKRGTKDPVTIFRISNYEFDTPPKKREEEEQKKKEAEEREKEREKKRKEVEQKKKEEAEVKKRKEEEQKRKEEEQKIKEKRDTAFALLVDYRESIKGNNFDKFQKDMKDLNPQEKLNYRRAIIQNVKLFYKTRFGDEVKIRENDPNFKNFVNNDYDYIKFASDIRNIITTAESFNRFGLDIDADGLIIEDKPSY